MTIRKDISVIQNLWHDAQRVDQEDMDTEQNQNNSINAATVNNHFGSGILPNALIQTVLFDSDDLNSTQAAILAANNFDGIGLAAHAQPSESNLGNQLEVELTDSDVFGRLSVKVAIIGLSFDNTLQMDRFYFHKNEKQVTSKHYKTILTILTNDFKGNNNCSRTLGGRLVIRETASFQLSRDALMVAQDVEPDLFWRDFKVSDLNVSLFDTIQTGMGSEYSADGLNINITGTSDRELAANDVTSQVGQKFQAKTNNIQKITLLLGARPDDAAAEANKFDWTGDLVISVYPLQTSVSCPTDLVPELAIDFDPDSVPLAQLSYSQATLRDYGYVLTDVLQPIDFVFNATSIASVNSTGTIEADKFYAITMRRSGAATAGTIFIGTGNDRLDDSRVTLFSGVWVDVPEEDLWFQVWTDAAKLADGQAYDAGTGIQIDKTETDSATGATIDKESRYYALADTGENILNTAVVQAVTTESVTVQDERTGNPIQSRQQFTPSFSFVNDANLADLKSISEPLIIGAMQDTNPKINPTIQGSMTLPGLVRGDSFCIINPDPDLLSHNLLGSKLIPNDTYTALDYRIFKVTVCTDGYGDVLGNGEISSDDIAAASALIGESHFYNSTQSKIADGTVDIYQLLRADVDGDGYVTSNDVDLITQYVNRQINSFAAGSSFTRMCLRVQPSIGRMDGYFDCDGYVRLDGYTGLNIVNASDLTAAELIYDGYLLLPTMELSDPTFLTVPFPEVTFTVQPQPFWQDYLLAETSQTRQVPASFTSTEAIVPADCTSSLTFTCEDRNDVTPEVDPGRNDFFVPDHLVIGNGEILRPNGDNYKIDLEIGTVILQLPQVPLDESAINIFDKFVADRGDGRTIAGYPAMRYSDCSTVQPTDLAAGKVRFSVALQALVPNLDGYDIDGYGVIVNNIIGVYMDHSTGIVKLTISDLEEDSVFMTLVTKLQIQVFLKKGGWNNNVLTINSSEVEGLISS